MTLSSTASLMPSDRQLITPAYGPKPDVAGVDLAAHTVTCHLAGSPAEFYICSTCCASFVKEADAVAHAQEIVPSNGVVSTRSSDKR